MFQKLFLGPCSSISLTCTFLVFVDLQSDDPELEAIRQRRIAELMARSGQVGEVLEVPILFQGCFLGYFWVQTNPCAFFLHASTCRDPQCRSKTKNDRRRQKPRPRISGKPCSLPFYIQALENGVSGEIKTYEAYSCFILQNLTAYSAFAVSRIALVKPDKARRVEDIIINAAKRGSLSGKVTEEALIGLLEQINEQTASKTKVTIQRRRMFDDED